MCVSRVLRAEEETWDSMRGMSHQGKAVWNIPKETGPLGGLKRWQVPDPAGPAGCGMDYGF